MLRLDLTTVCRDEFAADYLDDVLRVARSEVAAPRTVLALIEHVRDGVKAEQAKRQKAKQTNRRKRRATK